MEALTTTPLGTRSRRPRRLGIDAHTDFVGTLVSELDSAVASLQAAARRVPAGSGAEGEVDLVDTARVDVSANDVLRLVRLLEAIDSPADQRHMELISLPAVLAMAAKSLDIDLSIVGAVAGRRFLGDAKSIQLGAELVLLAFGGGDSPVVVGAPDDRLVLIEGAFEMSDERRAWQLRCGRRVLEGENCRVRVIRGRSGYRLEIRALEP
ncbi:MAG: hypothetical protein QOJ23_2613 [Actinomycetota bacterium]|nr:hypothetical protein [Actinomycetota bacterium]